MCQKFIFSAQLLGKKRIRRRIHPRNHYYPTISQCSMLPFPTCQVLEATHEVSLPDSNTSKSADLTNIRSTKNMTSILVVFFREETQTDFTTIWSLIHEHDEARLSLGATEGKLLRSIWGLDFRRRDMSKNQLGPVRMCLSQLPIS